MSKQDETISDSEGRIDLRDACLDRRISFFSGNPALDLRLIMSEICHDEIKVVGNQVIYISSDRASRKVQADIKQKLNPRKESVLSWDYVESLILKMTVTVKPLKKGCWIIEINKVNCDPELERRLSEVLEREPLARAVWARLNFGTIDQVKRFLANFGVDFDDEFERSARFDMEERRVKLKGLSDEYRGYGGFSMSVVDEGMKIELRFDFVNYIYRAGNGGRIEFLESQGRTGFRVEVRVKPTMMTNDRGVQVELIKKMAAICQQPTNFLED